MTTLTPEAISTWHRQLCTVTPWLVISGDLSQRRASAEVQVREWVEFGITDVVDVRGEWSDQEFLADHAPHIRYHHLGTHDDGTTQSDEWFRHGVSILHDALAHPDAKVLVHCHMGVNRGPSMAFAFLLEQGWDPIAALDAIRTARPIAGIIYARDALRAFQGTRTPHDCSNVDDVDRVEKWFVDNDIDIATIIRRIRVTGSGN